MKKRVLRLMLLILLLPGLSGCWYVAAAGAGAAITYVAVQEGYKVQSPVTHDVSKQQQDKE